MLRSCPVSMDLSVIEPRPDIGRGLAYAAVDRAHSINVPSDKMGIFADEPMQFTRWLAEQSPAALAEEAKSYPPRFEYGSFVVSILQKEIAERRQPGKFRHVRARAVDVSRSHNAWQVVTDGSGAIEADIVVLAYGHGLPSPPFQAGQQTPDHPKFVKDPWSLAGTAAVGASDDVLIVGSGLTMADTVAGLHAAGHRGKITVISRRALLPRPHSEQDSQFDFLGGRKPPVSALRLLRLVRSRIAENNASTPWQSVIDGVRTDLPVLWSSLPIREKRQAVRRLMPFWEVHRFRIAPQIHEILKTVQREGRMLTAQGTVRNVELRHSKFTAELALTRRLREKRDYDAVVLCTGPNKDPNSNPFVASLLRSRFACLDDTGTGLAVDKDGNITSGSEIPSTGLFAFGPMTRGTFGEMTGAPPIAAFIARAVAAMLAARGLAAGQILAPAVNRAAM
jgi:uncharacterized NAD(P)/FAD-binding protein YdhS